MWKHKMNTKGGIVMLQIWPISARAAKGNVVGLVVSIIIYIVIAAVVPFVLGVFHVAGLVGTILGFAMWIFNVYCGVGIIVSILAFLGIVK